MKKLIYGSTLALLIFALVPAGSAFAAGKIALSPSSSTVMEGQSQLISIQLDAPIVATPPGNYVTLNIITSNPETVTVSPSSVTFAAHEWAQAKTFTLIVPANGTYGDTRNVMILASAVSGSSYYNGVGVTANMHVTDTTPEPGSSPPQDDPAPEPEDDEAPAQDADIKTNYQADGGVQHTADAARIRAEQRAAYDNTDEINRGNGVERLKIMPGLAVKRVADVFVPSEASAVQRAGLYILTALMGCSVIAAMFVVAKRRNWWQRQKAQDARWYYRHQKSKPTKKKPARTKRPVAKR